MFKWTWTCTLWWCLTLVVLIEGQQNDVVGKGSCTSVPRCCQFETAEDLKDCYVDDENGDFCSCDPICYAYGDCCSDHKDICRRE